MSIVQISIARGVRTIVRRRRRRPLWAVLFTFSCLPCPCFRAPASARSHSAPPHHCPEHRANAPPSFSSTPPLNLRDSVQQDHDCRWRAESSCPVIMVKGAVMASSEGKAPELTDGATTAGSGGDGKSRVLAETQASKDPAGDDDAGDSNTVETRPIWRHPLFHAELETFIGNQSAESKGVVTRPLCKDLWPGRKVSGESTMHAAHPRKCWVVAAVLLFARPARHVTSSRKRRSHRPRLSLIDAV